MGFTGVNAVPVRRGSEPCGVVKGKAVCDGYTFLSVIREVRILTTIHINPQGPTKYSCRSLGMPPFQTEQHRTMREAVAEAFHGIGLEKSTPGVNVISEVVAAGVDCAWEPLFAMDDEFDRVDIEDLVEFDAEFTAFQARSGLPPT